MKIKQYIKDKIQTKNFEIWWGKKETKIIT